MRLLHCETRTLHEFIDGPPLYAILSHTWEEDEITFQEIQNPTPAVLEKKGYKKIEKCCEIAKEDGLEYMWVDTCCIDKTSSAELSEAINSMYKWYRLSDVCYVYLFDFDSKIKEGKLPPSFGLCRWFSRGWTLQELIAPSNVLFFNQHWEELGTKLNLRSVLHRITGIQLSVLNGESTSAYSVAQKMCWAAKRTTTRIEDMAYCLLGIFDIHMPLLYGEGDKSFIRLQETIMSRSTDLSMFAWESDSEERRWGNHHLLAKFPAQFKDCSNIFRKPNIQLTRSRIMRIGDGGIHLELPILRLPNRLCALLDCSYESATERHVIALCLDSRWDNERYTVPLDLSYKSFKLCTVMLSDIKSCLYRPLFIPQMDLLNGSKSQLHGYETAIVDLSALSILKIQSMYLGTASNDGSTISFTEFDKTVLDDADYQGTPGLVLSDDSSNSVRLLLHYHLNDGDEMDRWDLEVILMQGMQPTQYAGRPALEDNLATEGLFWKHVSGRWALSVKQRRRIINGQKAVVITLSDHALSPTT